MDAIAVDIVDNMIPVAWDGSTLIKADKSNTNNNWYDYDTQKWANAVLVTNSSRENYKSSTQGTEVLEDDVLAYYTYIPRYRYLLWNTNNNENCLNDNCNEQEIMIEFENSDKKKSLGSQNGEWLTHPAFTFGESELNGLWVGKFATSPDTESACYTSPATDNCNVKSITPRVKPNLDMWRYIRVATMSSVSKQIETDNMYGLNSYDNADSHMMKNMEWGAVAYLSHSKYGKYGNENYVGENKQLYINNYGRVEAEAYKTETGCSSGTFNAGRNTISCSHQYPEQTLEATGASTTGNIYGVYDMSGGVWEYVMGQLVQEGTELGTFYSTPSSGSWDTMPELKYYDSYEYDTDVLTHGRGYLGDATRETLKTFGASETGGWYTDFSSFPSSENVWFLRGGYASEGLRSGIFAYYRNSGYPSYYGGFRVVLAIE